MNRSFSAPHEDPEWHFYPCPCCGYFVFDNPPGSYDICPICFWEDDESQLRFASIGGGANTMSLLEAQRNYAAFGASEERLKPLVRPPRPGEVREMGWRCLDPAIDNIEAPHPGVGDGVTYPKDSTALYYWRESYWRRGCG
jgi:hypothetical protein